MTLKSPKKNLLSFISYSLILSGGLLLDQFVKAWAYNELRPIRSIKFIPEILNLTYRENTGAAFSILSNMTNLLTVMTCIISVLIFYILMSGKITNMLAEFSLIFIVTGGIGNCIDRITRGFVVDMFEFAFVNFAIFNVADIFITCGSALFILVFIITKGESLKW